MLFINTEENLKKEKICFFNTHLDFIHQFMPDLVKDYVTGLINNEVLLPFNINNIDLKLLDDNVFDKKLFYCILYVCCREIDSCWEGFFFYIQPLYPALGIDFSSEFSFENTTSPPSDLYSIRQCRVDKPLYTDSVNVNVGFYNKNENFNYQCYDDYSAKEYLVNYCSPKALLAYKNIQYPQAKSDFFLMASLYTDGGISADVCSIAQSNLEILIKNTDFLLIYDDKGLQKKFIFAQPRNLFILYHLNFLIEEMNYFGADQDYDNLFSRSAFHSNFMDYYAFCYQYIKDIRINFLHDDIYTAFVHGGISEESLSCANDFPFMVAKGAFRSQEISKHTSLIPNIEVSSKNFYVPPTNNLTIIGHDNNPQFINRVQTPYSLPSLNVWEVDNVDLYGLGWVCKNNQFISFETHLSNLAFNSDYQRIWPLPKNNDITKVIEDECIIAFNAGSHCYGHYLVDDLPRIGLIKDYLGNEFYDKKFIISKETPEWGKTLLKYFFNLRDDHFIVFDFSKEIWRLNKVFLSSYVTKDNYNFHGYVRQFYRQYYQAGVKPYRRVCLSRALCNPNTRHQRIFQSREVFEYLALSYDFEVICPESLSIEEQIQLMAETTCQIGEHGSAQHSSVFNPYGMVVGTLNPIGDIQIALGRVYNDKNIICYSDSIEWGGPNNEVLYYDIEQEKLITFFEKVLQTLRDDH
ncbi:glycosyltransferase family 61 protein [Commensalibacter papalotli (ex Servin-Garciduenas et al. 2014)]|uniref:Glycosyltransferase 61 catalytic domain-containing protein n=1 Tax=Commensalibacter papalotli (ex Servin-Garciduenas et al. 2014) TaxID=1208583 RepID=W7DTF9_9PROT|nr:glycosyltransferase family 61 protein [Commensalibacter papalotli (ex Servin-Garciduenas et al. 2014)]EUK17543.1 hypothetical protein COMX_09782 [Commensalibacter papalotli (ex Servin-Garciduenas et al. 2014)]